MLRKFGIIICVMLISACNDELQETAEKTRAGNSTAKYAKRFSITRDSGNKVVHLFGNRANYDTTASFLLYRDTFNLRDLPVGYQAVKIPCRKIAALSSIYASMLIELGELDAIAAIDNIDYVNNTELLQKFRDETLPQLARSPQIDLEQTIALRPDIVFTYGMGDGSEIDTKLLRSGIHVAVSVDHLEESPLARAEWMKFFAAFVDRSEEADAIFRSVESGYLHLKDSATQFMEKPAVFSELKFGDVWYMPGGKSYVAQLIHDAGASYLWRHEPKSGSLPLSFEQVYALARNADFWINISMIKSKAELLSHDKRYAEFKAFREGNLYNNNKVANAGGFSIYWETGMMHPERILSDLIRIFHPVQEKKPGNDLYYYRRIE